MNARDELDAAEHAANGPCPECGGPVYDGEHLPGCPRGNQPAERLLAQIAAQVRDAREALADEHEGNLRRAAMFLASDADKLLTLVTTW